MPGDQERAPAPGFREKLSWCLFDFANSSFTTVIVTVVYAAYFADLVVGDAWHGFKGDTLWNQIASLSQLVVLVSAPVIGAMADRRACKKRYLLVSYLFCVMFTALLSFTGSGTVVLAMALFLVANVAFSTGENLVAGFLPELAPPEEMGRLSGYGWAVGYIGGLLALVLALWLVNLELTRWTSLSTALFFGVAGIPTFLFLRERAVPAPGQVRGGLVREAFRELRTTWSERRRFVDMFRFLLCVLLFQSGVVIVIVNASIYGQGEIGMSQEDMILLFIGLQLSAGLGALGFGMLQDRIGSRPTLMIALTMWLASVLVAWSATSVFVYAVAGILAGASMGSSQSASRAVVGLMCPRGREAEWFGLWGFATKAAAVIGPLTYSLIVQALDRRSAILFTGVFFALGMGQLLLVNVERGRRAAEVSR